mgnify:CR=1 FL=1|jgi:hypothetical protein
MQIEITEAELEVLITALAKCANDGLTFVEMSQKLKQYITATESIPAEE